MSATIQADKEGNLHLPSKLLPNGSPLAIYRIDSKTDKIIISKENSLFQPFWKTATPTEKLEALNEWLEEAATPLPRPGADVSRDSIYD